MNSFTATFTLVLAVIVLSVALCVTTCTAVKAPIQTPAATYAKSGKIVDIDREKDIVTFVDCVGYLWTFEEVEDFEVGDWVACVMDTNGTENIFDDKILSIRYESWGD